MTDTVVLAYSGGLDTSVAVPWLRETRGVDVVTLTADVGAGASSDEVLARAIAGGAREALAVDARAAFVTDFVWPTLQAGARYQGVYPLATAIARPLIARLLVEVAHDVGARSVAHGCTGKGNDQVRFDVAVAALDPSLSGDRADAGRDGDESRRRGRLRSGPGHRDRCRTRIAVQHRPQPVGPVGRGRRPRGSLGRAATGGVRMDRRPCRRTAGAARGGRRVRVGHSGQP